MKRKIIFCLFISMLVIVLNIFTISNFSYATITDVDNNPEHEEYLENTKVFKFDAKTNEETEVNMEEIEQKILKNRLYTNDEIPDYTSSYTPENTVLVSKMSPRAVEGAMVKIANSRNQPYIKVCKIIWDGTSADSGSGFMVASNLLLTTAHCIFDSNGNIKSGLSFMPGYDDGIYNNCSSGWQTLYYGNYIQTGNRGGDWCLVELDWHMGNEVGWFGCQSYGNNSSYENLYIHSIGYPTEPLYSAGKCQYYSPGTIYDVFDGYFISTSGCRYGMSGGPAMVWANDSVVGINQSIRIGDSEETVLTRACKIHGDIIDIILTYQ